MHNARKREGFCPSDAIAHSSENQPAHRPAGDKDRRRISTGLLDEPGIKAERRKRRDSRISGQDEQLLVQAIEQPCEGGDQKNKPMITVQLTPPWTRTGRTGGNTLR